MAALAMFERPHPLNARRAVVGQAPFENGIGSIGSSMVAARLEALTKAAEQHILIHPATFIGLQYHLENISATLSGKVRRRTEPIVVHAITGFNAMRVEYLALLPVSASPTVS